jgi:hypothetical protein
METAMLWLHSNACHTSQIIDLTAAFDSVTHILVLRRIQPFGLQRPTLRPEAFIISATTSERPVDLPNVVLVIAEFTSL